MASIIQRPKNAYETWRTSRLIGTYISLFRLRDKLPNAKSELEIVTQVLSSRHYNELTAGHREIMGQLKREPSKDNQKMLNHYYLNVMERVV
jgi:hypothetical protein